MKAPKVPTLLANDWWRLDELATNAHCPPETVSTAELHNKTTACPKARDADALTPWQHPSRACERWCRKDIRPDLHTRTRTHQSRWDKTSSILPQTMHHTIGIHCGRYGKQGNRMSCATVRQVSVQFSKGERERVSFLFANTLLKTVHVLRHRTWQWW